jgi:DNA-binding MarR family transcriptional regulator
MSFAAAAPELHRPNEPGSVRPDLAGELRVAVSRLARRLRTSTGGGLTSSQLSALFAIEASGPLRLADLSSIERVSAPTITRIVDRLEEAGLVSRQPDPHDRRGTLVSITGKARSELRRVRTERTALLQRQLAELSAADRAALEAALPVLKALAEGGQA